MAARKQRVFAVYFVILWCLVLSRPANGLRKARSGMTNPFVNRYNTSSSTVAKKLREMTKLSNGYDKWVRPNDSGAPVNVLVEMKIMSFGKVREDEMDFTLDIFFRQWWTDNRLAHGIKKVFNMAANPTKYFWTPDTYFVNVKSSNFHHVTRENTRLMIYPDGRVYYSTRVTLTAQCKMEFSFFPMDTQVCLLQIESYAYTIEDVTYNWNDRGDNSIEIYADEMAQFDRGKVYTTKLESSNSKGSFDSLRAFFKFKRRSSYFFVQHYIPTAFIVFISWLSFWINKNAVPARVSLTVTCILSTMVLFESINSSLPRISYLKAIDYYLITSFFFILASMVEYCVVLNVIEKNTDLSRKNSVQAITEQGCIITDVMDMENQFQHRERSLGFNRPRRDAKLANGYAHHTSTNTPLMKRETQNNYQLGEFLSSECFRNGEEPAHFIDRYSRRVFPLLYLLFNIGYWSYFLPKVG